MLEELRRQLYDCSRCGFCRVWGWKGIEYVCPTYQAGPGWETQYARGRVRMAQALLDHEIEVTGSYLDHAFSCTLCGSCEVLCPVGVPLTDIFHAWRADLAESGHVLPDHQRAANLTRKYLNPYGPDWSRKEEDQSPPRKKAKILFYPGCTTNRMAPETVEAVVEMLGKLDLDFALFEDDTCCGFPLHEVGLVDEARTMAAETLGRIMEHEPDTVLTTCPACFKSFDSILPDDLDLVVDFEAQHISKFLLPFVKDRLKPTDIKVTWHDPCILGRHLGIYEEPRELLKAVPGLELKEMSANREDSLCCGAGGGVYFAFQSTANQAVCRRLEDALETQADEIVTSCPNCYVRFRQMSRSNRMGIRAKSLAQVINEALD